MNELLHNSITLSTHLINHKVVDTIPPAAYICNYHLLNSNMKTEKILTWKQQYDLNILERNKRIKQLHKQRHTLRAIGLVVGLSGEGVRRALMRENEGEIMEFDKWIETNLPTIEAGAKSRTEWQPIETAPTDGTRILLARCGKTETGADLGVWWACAGWWSDKWKVWFDGVEPSGLHKPTHWMHLPEAPSANQTEETK